MIIFMIPSLKFKKVTKSGNYAVSVEAQPQGLQIQKVHFIKRICIGILDLLVSGDARCYVKIAGDSLLQLADARQDML